MQHKRVACAAALAVLSLAGTWRPAGASSAPPPTPADFVGLPACMLYARGADVRVRVRAPHAAAACRTLTGQLARMGVRWTLHVQPIHHVLSPICLIADPHGRIELQVIDDARNPGRGAGICTDLARAGWLILGR